MSYLPFARKWRPQNFDEVVGQEHVTTTLKNAIAMNRVHHAYLFTGPRGIGKTSTARILSKALNCDKGPTPKPCHKCSACLEITSGVSLDIIEIDGASNNGVDEIRNLREAVKFSPSKGRFKIYIIDEVHMLTVAAFNALLKTLEEPPAHVKFIFATTEPHKLPATILSRCQRFDFRRISVREIIDKLKEITKAEKLDIEDGVFLYIARASDGSMRDAESILDQIASFSKGKVKIKDVINALGMIEEETLFKCTDLIIEKNPKSIITLTDRILNSGKDAKEFLSNLLEHFRNIMLAKVGAGSDDLIDLPKERLEILNKQARSFSKGDIFYIINVISNSLRMIKQLIPERIVLELCMIKLATRDSVASIEELLSKLPDIQQETAQTAPSARPAPQPKPTYQETKKPDAKQETKAKPQQTMSKKIEDSLKSIVRPPKKEVKYESDEKPGGSPVEIGRVKTAWPILVKAMGVKKMSIASYLAEGQPDCVKGNKIHVAFPRELNFHREVLEERQNKEAIEAALSQIMDAKVRLEFIATDMPVKHHEPAKTPLTKEELMNKEPIIDNALNIFGGKIIRARNT